LPVLVIRQSFLIIFKQPSSFSRLVPLCYTRFGKWLKAA
jgi:hypothetical protein